MSSNIKKELKAFVRLTGGGRVVSGSLIFRKNKPKTGNWIEVGADRCCVITTTTTTTAGPTTTTTTTTT
jgi:hypothetical protein